MEESPGAQMDTDVTSTTEDVVEVQASNGPHRNVETVIVVEVIKEEDMRKERERSLQEGKPKNISDAAKTPETSPQKDNIPIKKIIIKSPLKEFQPKTVVKSPAKPEEAPKTLSKDAEKLPQPSSSQQAEDIVDSSSKIESTESPKKDDKPQSSPTKDSDVQKIAPKSPLITSDKITASPTVSNKTKSNTDESKESSAKVTITKDNTLKISPTKDSLPKVTKIKILPIKEPVSKPIPAKETLPKITIIKEPAKTAVKEAVKPTKPPQTVPENVESSDNTEELKIRTNNIVSAMDIDKEASNDSQTNSDISEKDHNKSISRELRSLINSAKESKIISECTQLTSKTRKSRTPLDTSITNTSIEAEKIQGVRRGSDNSQKSGCSEKSDKISVKRSMRSQNPEFVSKVKNFLNTVTGKVSKEDEDTSDEEMSESKSKESKENDTDLASSTPKKKKIETKVSFFCLTPITFLTERRRWEEAFANWQTYLQKMSYAQLLE